MRAFPLNIKIGAIDNFTSSFANLSKKMNRLGKQASSLGRKMTVGLTAPIVGFGALSVKSAADIEQMTVALEGMAGGAEGAKNLMKELMDFSASTPFQLEGISNAARMLLATEKIRVDELQGALTVAGDIAAGSKAEISEIAYVMSKAAAKGRADMEILNMFLERGIPIMGALQRETGANQKALEKMVSAGQITYDKLYRSMRSLRDEGGVFENMMQKQSVTIKGLLSTLSDNFKLASASIGDSIVKTTRFQARITSLTESIQGFTKWFNALPPGLQEIGVWAAILIAALGPIIFGFGQLVIGMGVMVALAPQIAAGFAAITAAAPWLLLVGLLAGVAFLFIKLMDNVGGFKNAIILLGASITDGLLLPMRLVAKVWNKILGTFNMAPKWLTRFANGSITKGLAKRMQEEQGGPTNDAAAAIKTQKEININNNSQADINVKFDNMPKGARPVVKSENNANVTIDQGVAMEGTG